MNSCHNGEHNLYLNKLFDKMLIEVIKQFRIWNYTFGIQKLCQMCSYFTVVNEVRCVLQGHPHWKLGKYKLKNRGRWARQDSPQFHLSWICFANWGDDGDREGNRPQLLGTDQHPALNHPNPVFHSPPTRHPWHALLSAIKLHFFQIGFLVKS